MACSLLSQPGFTTSGNDAGEIMGREEADSAATAERWRSVEDLADSILEAIEEQTGGSFAE